MSTFIAASFPQLCGPNEQQSARGFALNLDKPRQHASSVLPLTGTNTPIGMCR